MGVSPREPLHRVGDLARTAEERGFDAFWMIDFQLGMKDVYAAMNVAALATDRIQIGPSVTNLTTRHPTVTANAMTALDELSDGRALLGLGAGWSAVLGAGGRPSRVAEIEEGIAALRGLLRGDEVELDGVRPRLATARREIPIYLAASQPRLLDLAGRTCDGAILMGAADVDFCRWQLEHIYAGLEQAGRSRSEILIDLLVTMSVGDTDATLDDVRAWATSQAATFKPWKAMPPGFERFRPEFERAAGEYELVEHLSLRASHKGAVSDDFVRAVAIADDRDACVARIAELAALDVDRITFALLSGGREKRLEQLADVTGAIG
jgi:5,10-methylenetetrahydromethanopterin reductase